MATIEFVDELPPIAAGTRERGHGITQQFVRELLNNPGRWAKYPNTISRSSSLTVYRRNYPDVEWTGRKRDDGRADVYARWIGPPAA